jgi:sulfatase modifying factor 1
MKRIITGIFVVAALAVAMEAYAASDIEMVKVKGGCYQMGDTFGDGEANEKPVHKVCVDDFFMGKYLVTQEQWRAVVGNNPSFINQCGGNCPVEQVSWEDAQEFIQQLNEQTGKNYRLPYEAEWEYAARSGGKQEEWAGTSNHDELEEYAWFVDNSFKRTYPVGRKKPNGLGLYDMSGNVPEWCNDWYDGDYYKRSPENNPPGPLSGDGRVLRGGSCNDSAGDVRAAYRSSGGPSGRDDYDGGFRLVLPAIQRAKPR